MKTRKLDENLLNAIKEEDRATRIEKMTRAIDEFKAVTAKVNEFIKNDPILLDYLSPPNINDVKNTVGTSILMIAVEKAYDDVLKMLIDVGVDVNAQTPEGQTVLMLAGKKGHPACLKTLLDAKADVNIYDRNGQTALMFAATNGNAECLRLLLGKNIDINAQDKIGDNALSMAAYAGFDVCVKILLDAKANVDAQDNDGRTALIWAAKNGHTTCIKELLVAEPDVSIKSKQTGRTALECAASKHPKCVQLIKDYITLINQNNEVPKSTNKNKKWNFFSRLNSNEQTYYQPLLDDSVGNEKKLHNRKNGSNFSVV